jgi:lipopolysaccharide transport system permease protein
MRQHLFLLREMVRRDFQGRYAGSMLGLVWSFVQPLWLLVLYHFVFRTVLKVSLAFERTEHFAVFLFCGLLPWNAVHEGVLRSSTAITDNASLVKKLRFPSELLVLSVVLAALVHEAIAGALFLAVLVALGEMSWRGLPVLLLAVPLQAALTLGLGLVLASLQVFFRDTVQMLGMAMTGWFFLTPIVYPVSLVPEGLRPWIELNPLTALVGLYRRALLGGEPLLVPGTGTLAGAALLALLMGVWLFRRARPAFVDEI